MAKKDFSRRTTYRRRSNKEQATIRYVLPRRINIFGTCLSKSDFVVCINKGLYFFVYNLVESKEDLFMCASELAKLRQNPPQLYYSHYLDMNLH
jgi:hypothetical protein